MEPHDLNSGALAPVADEYECYELACEGEIPAALNGTLMRNGPNPYSGRFTGTDMLSWWPEAAMLHALEFAHGRALSYRNRWVRTKNWAEQQQMANAESYVATNPNVNIIQHGAEILALAEGGPPLAINRDLDTLGLSVAHPALAKGITAHPKIDPLSGEMMAFRADWSEPWLRYCVYDATGNETVDQIVDVPAPAMLHDMAITPHYSVLMDLNVAYDFSLFEQGYRIPIRWFDERAARLCLIPRHGGEPLWLAIDPCFIQHVVNAWEPTENTVTLDVVRYPSFLKVDPETQAFSANPLGTLWRYRINLINKTVHEQQLDDLHIELPRINESYTGFANRYAYAVEQPSDTEMRGIVRYDTTDGSRVRHAIAPGNQNSEPVFVPHPKSASEEDGWVLVSVYVASQDSNEIHILDANNIDTPPLAKIKLERRIPAGFHGAWIPADGNTA